MSDVGLGKICGGCCSCFSIIWGFTLAIWVIDELRQTRVDFEQILHSIPDPQIRVVNDNKFLGPINIICSPQMLQNDTNSTCSDIFNSYKSLTTTQKYFSLLFLDSTKPITDTTIDDMVDGRHSLFIYFCFCVIMACIGKIFSAIGKCATDVEKSYSEKVLGGMFAAVNAMFGVNIMHMFMCNLFFISEETSGVYLLQYVPVWAFWTALIVVVSFPLFIGCCGCFATLCGCEQESVMACLLLIIGLFGLAVYVLWGFSAYGLFVYIWNFNANFQAKNVTNSIVILKPEYIESVKTIKKIATAIGGLAIYDVVIGIFNAFV